MGRGRGRSHGGGGGAGWVVAAPRAGRTVEGEETPAGSIQGGGGGRGLVGDLRAGDPYGDGEGDPVRIDPGLVGSLGPEGTQRLIDAQETEEFLTYEVWGLGAEDEFRAAQAGFHFLVT